MYIVELLKLRIGSGNPYFMQIHYGTKMLPRDLTGVAFIYCKATKWISNREDMQTYKCQFINVPRFCSPWNLIPHVYSLNNSDTHLLKYRCIIIQLSICRDFNIKLKYVSHLFILNLLSCISKSHFCYRIYYKFYYEMSIIQYNSIEN